MIKKWSKIKMNKGNFLVRSYLPFLKYKFTLLINKTHFLVELFYLSNVWICMLRMVLNVSTLLSILKEAQIYSLACEAEK